MTASEQATFAAGIRYAIGMAQIAAVTIEVRPDARDIRQLAAVAAHYGLVEGLKAQAGSETGALKSIGKTAGFVNRP